MVLAVNGSDATSHTQLSLSEMIRNQPRPLVVTLSLPPEQPPSRPLDEQVDERDADAAAAEQYVEAVAGELQATWREPAHAPTSSSVAAVAAAPPPPSSRPGARFRSGSKVSPGPESFEEERRDESFEGERRDEGRRVPLPLARRTAQGC